MKGSTTVTEISKYEHILKERNSVISHYKEKCDGLLEIRGLLEGLIYCLISEVGEAVINKALLSAGMKGRAIFLREDGDNYYLSLGGDNISPSAGDENGEDKA